MKGRSISILGLFAAAAGAIFILCHNAISVGGLTIAFGVLFVAVGLINLIFFSSVNADSSSARVMSMISNAASIVLGISMLVYTDRFAPLIAFMLGLLVAVCALWQFFLLAIGARPYQLPVWLYIFPVIIMAGAIYIYIIKGDDNEPMLMLITGISIAVLGAGCILEGSILGMARRRDRKATAMAAQAHADTDPEAISATTSSDAPAYETPRTHKTETTENLDDIAQ